MCLALTLLFIAGGTPWLPCPNMLESSAFTVTTTGGAVTVFTAGSAGTAGEAGVVLGTAGAGAGAMAGCDGGGGDGVSAIGVEDEAGAAAAGGGLTGAADATATRLLAAGAGAGGGAGARAGAGEPLSLYTLSELTSQYASLKAPGLFCTKALHDPPWAAAQLPPHALPAHAPQNVLSKTSWWLEKC